MASNNGYGDAIITTTDEDGEVHLFEKIQDLDFEGKAYALMVYLGKEGEYDAEEAAKKAEDEGYDEEVVVMKVSTEDGGVEVYEAVEDEDEFKRIVTHIEKLMEDEDELVIDLEELLQDSEGNENN